MSENNSIKYLKDEPIAIENSEIAKVIFDEIKQCSSDENKQGKVIGLLGGWGSGKSSVIKSLIDINDRENKKFGLLEYDAWKNEKYPFKLAFLKFLFGNIDDKTNETIYKKELKELQTVLETQEKQEYSLLDLPNTLIAIPILFYPLANKLIIEKSVELFSFIQEISFSIGLGILQSIPVDFHVNTLGVIFFVLFFILLILNSLISNVYSRNKHKKGSNCFKEIMKNIKGNLFILTIVSIVLGFGFKNLSGVLIYSLPLAIWLVFYGKDFVLKVFGKKEEFFLFSATKPPSRSIITVNKTPEPNFEDFNNLYEKLIGTFKEKNLIIVIDNIDRIDAEEAKSIWSALKGMVLKNKCVNIIIPIDEEQILNIFKDDPVTADNETMSFIQKTFDIVFRVSPFILTKAKETWSENLKQAFNDKMSESEINKIISIFDTRDYEAEEDKNKEAKDKIFKKSTYAGTVTPRKIIKLINEVVSLEKIDIFKDIPIITKFTYCLHYKNISYNLSKGTISGLLPQNRETLRSINLDNLIALYYSVKPEEAFDIIKHQDFSNKIENEKFEFDKSEIEHENTWTLLSKIVDEKTDGTFSVFTNMLNNLTEINKQNPDESFKESVSSILSQISQLQSFNIIPQNAGEILSNAFKLDASSREKILKTLYSYQNTDGYKDAKKWLNCSDAILSEIEDCKKTIYVIEKPLMPNDLYSVIIPLINCEENDLYDTHMLKPKDMSEVITQAEKDATIFEHVNFYLSKPPQGAEKIKTWKSTFTSVIGQKLDNLIASGESSEVFDLIIKGILNFKEYSWIQHISTNFYNKLTDIYPQKELLGKGFAIYVSQTDVLEKINQTESTFYRQGLYRTTISETSIGFLKTFVETYLKINENKLMNIFKLPAALTNRKDLINYALKNNKEFSLTFKEFIVIFDGYYKYFPLIGELYRKATIQENYLKDLNNVEFNDDNINLLYFLLYQKDTEVIKPKAIEYLENPDSVTWSSEAENLSTKFKIAIKTGFSNSDFTTALKELSKIIAQKTPTIFVEEVEAELEILQELDKKYRFINDYMDGNLSTLQNGADILVENFGDSVVRWLKKTTHHDKDTIYTDFIRHITNQEWISKYKNILAKYEPEEDTEL